MEKASLSILLLLLASLIDIVATTRCWARERLESFSTITLLHHVAWKGQEEDTIRGLRVPPVATFEKEKICDHFPSNVKSSKPRKDNMMGSIESSPIPRTGAEEAIPLVGMEQDAGSQKPCFEHISQL
jgi:hypothetical protein